MGHVIFTVRALIGSCCITLNSASLCRIGVGLCCPRRFKSGSDLKWMTSICFVTANICQCEKPCRIRESSETSLHIHKLQWAADCCCAQVWSEIWVDPLYWASQSSVSVPSFWYESSLVLLSRVFGWRIRLWVVFRFSHPVAEIFGHLLQRSGSLSEEAFRRLFNKKL